MNIPSLECAHCGSRQIRRARYLNWGERLRGVLGIHPFRCRKCTHRFLVSVWLFGKLRYAKCPRCLRLELTTWSRRYYKVGFIKTFLVVFGAQKYRCPACRCNFVSFRPRKAPANSGEQPSDVPGTGLNQSDDDDAVKTEARQEETSLESVRPREMDDGKPAGQPDSTDRVPARLTAVAEPAHIRLTPFESGTTSLLAREEPPQG